MFSLLCLLVEFFLSVRNVYFPPFSLDGKLILTWKKHDFNHPYKAILFSKNGLNKSTGF